jgi:lipopolysaccharide/colanic/teichoic acid biosynthesis glycosyltransferase
MFLAFHQGYQPVAGSVIASALVALIPLLLLLAVAVRMSSPGPILYHWRVRGRHGRPFTGYKFRTMVQDADKLKADLMAWNDMSGPVFKMVMDPRVTSAGRWLRKYSLDELPQLWSVIKGDMSLVGPRPSFPSEYEKFELWQMRKLTVVPGMTCLWQSGGRNAISDFDEWVRLDLEYIDNWSLLLDFRILARTLPAVVRGTGAV